MITGGQGQDIITLTLKLEDIIIKKLIEEVRAILEEQHAIEQNLVAMMTLSFVSNLN